MSCDFANLLERLANGGVDFVLVGGFAGIVHGCTYVTQDIDICCDFSVGNLLSLQQAVSDLHPVHRMTPSRAPLQLTPQACEQLKNLYLDTNLGQLDCLSYVDGIGGYEEVKRASELVAAESIQIRVLTLDGLIKAKSAMHRPRDKETIHQLQAIKRLQAQKRGQS